MKVYLVVQMFERGFAIEEKPFAVYENKDVAENIAHHIYGYVRELDFNPKKG